MAAERTLILIKPDAMQRSLAGEALARLERRGLKIVAARLVHADRALAEQHYAEHVGKPFYEGLVSFITSAPLLALALEGERAIEAAGQTIGATDPVNAAPGTIRGDFGLTIDHNLVHRSDAPGSAEREIGLWFSPEDLMPMPETPSRPIES